MGNLGSSEVVVILVVLALVAVAVGVALKMLSARSATPPVGSSTTPATPALGDQASAEDESMRASSAERDRVIAKLQEEIGHGRLTLRDFEERMDSAQAATTVGELSQLVRDLPSQTR